MTNATIKLSLMELEASEIEKALPLFDKAKEIVQAFDGKIYNVKIERAFEAIGLRLHRDNGEIAYYIKNSSISIGEYDNEYIETRTISLSRNYKCKDVVKDKRIDATVWCQLIDVLHTYWQGRADHISKDIKNCLETIQKFNELKEELKELRDSLDYSTQKYFQYDLKV